jgi:hypothetical protein
MEPEPDLSFSDISIGDYSFARGLDYSQGQDDRQQFPPSNSANGYYEHPDVRRLKESNTINFTRNYSDPLPIATRKPLPMTMPPPPDMKRNESTFVMDISPSVVGWIIGRSGIRIKEIQAQTGCKMWVDQDVPNDQPRKIYFHGNKVNIDAAVHRVSELVQTAPILASAGAVSGKGLTSTIVDCPVSLVGLLIGKRGWTIKKIQQASGAQISINQSVREGLPRKIIVSGDDSAVANALHLIDEVLRDKTLMGEVEVGGHLGPAHYPPNAPPQYDYGNRGGRPGSPAYDPRMHGGNGGEHLRGHYDMPSSGGSRFAAAPVAGSPIRSHSTGHFEYEYGARPGGSPAPPPRYEPQQGYGQPGYGYADGGAPQQHQQRAPQAFYPGQQPQMPGQYLDRGAGGDDYMTRSRASSDNRGGIDDNLSGVVNGGMMSPGRHDYQNGGLPVPLDSSPYRGAPAQHSSLLQVAASEYPMRGMASSPIEYPMNHVRGNSLAGSPIAESRTSHGSPYGSPHMRALSEPRMVSSPVTTGGGDVFRRPSGGGYDDLRGSGVVGGGHSLYGSPGGSGSHQLYGSASGGPSANTGGFDPTAQHVGYRMDSGSSRFDAFDEHHSPPSGASGPESGGSRYESSRFFRGDDEEYPSHQSERDIDNLLYTESGDYTDQTSDKQDSNS